MNMRLVRGMIPGMFIVLNALAQPNDAVIRPVWAVISIPSTGFVDLDEDASACEHPGRPDWQSCSENMRVSVVGPAGAGRYWRVTIGVPDSTLDEPARGVCLTTTTLGWRTLQKFENAPLRWYEDVDGDERCELILWGSFPLVEEPTSAEYGLVGWVYSWDGNDILRIDENLTAVLASRLITAYRSPLPDTSERLSERRVRAADILEKFVRDSKVE